MSNTVTLKIDGQEVTVPNGTTILEAAAQLGIEIPVICYHPHLSANGLCRICSVDAGQRVQLAACVTHCGDDMEIETHNEDVGRGRRTVLEMLAATVNLDEAPEILQLLQEYEAEIDRFTAGAQRTAPIYDDNPFYLRDYNQCINCWRCVQVCAEDAQYTFALSFDGRGFHTQIGTFMGDGMTDTTCVFCGQCIGVCPTGALKSKRQALLEQGYDPDAIFEATRRKRRKKLSTGHLGSIS
ncbi:MAG: 4Fe-4S dicluster domain-containing protein [Chloroflexi bacterium]|nr:4Fe-4S dicluster domain-containing protein [Chloroflexota bacterium]